MGNEQTKVAPEPNICDEENGSRCSKDVEGVPHKKKRGILRSILDALFGGKSSSEDGDGDSASGSVGSGADFDFNESLATNNRQAGDGLRAPIHLRSDLKDDATEGTGKRKSSGQHGAMCHFGRSVNHTPCPRHDGQARMHNRARSNGPLQRGSLGRRFSPADVPEHIPAHPIACQHTRGVNVNQPSLPGQQPTSAYNCCRHGNTSGFEGMPAPLPSTHLPMPGSRDSAVRCVRNHTMHTEQIQCNATGRTFANGEPNLANNFMTEDTSVKQTVLKKQIQKAPLVLFSRPGAMPPFIHQPLIFKGSRDRTRQGENLHRNVPAAIPPRQWPPHEIVPRVNVEGRDKEREDNFKDVSPVSCVSAATPVCRWMSPEYAHHRVNIERKNEERKVNLTEESESCVTASIPLYYVPPPAIHPQVNAKGKENKREINLKEVSSTSCVTTATPPYQAPSSPDIVNMKGTDKIREINRTETSSVSCVSKDVQWSSPVFDYRANIDGQDKERRLPCVLPATPPCLGISEIASQANATEEDEDGEEYVEEVSSPPRCKPLPVPIPVPFPMSIDQYLQEEADYRKAARMKAKKSRSSKRPTSSSAARVATGTGFSEVERIRDNTKPTPDYGHGVLTNPYELINLLGSKNHNIAEVKRELEKLQKTRVPTKPTVKPLQCESSSTLAANTGNEDLVENTPDLPRFASPESTESKTTPNENQMLCPAFAKAIPNKVVFCGSDGGGDDKEENVLLEQGKGVKFMPKPPPKSDNAKFVDGSQKAHQALSAFQRTYSRTLLRKSSGVKINQTPTEQESAAKFPSASCRPLRPMLPAARGDGLQIDNSLLKPTGNTRPRLAPVFSNPANATKKADSDKNVQRVISNERISRKMGIPAPILQLNTTKTSVSPTSISKYSNAATEGKDTWHKGVKRLFDVTKRVACTSAEGSSLTNTILEADRDETLQRLDQEWRRPVSSRFFLRFIFYLGKSILEVKSSSIKANFSGDSLSKINMRDLNITSTPSLDLKNFFHETLDGWERRRPPVLFNERFYPRRLLLPCLHEVELTGNIFDIHRTQNLPIIIDIRELDSNVNGQKGSRLEQQVMMTDVTDVETSLPDLLCLNEEGREKEASDTGCPRMVPANEQTHGEQHAINIPVEEFRIADSNLAKADYPIMSHSQLSAGFKFGSKTDALESRQCTPLSQKESNVPVNATDSTPGAHKSSGGPTDRNSVGFLDSGPELQFRCHQQHTVLEAARVLAARVLATSDAVSLETNLVNTVDTGGRESWPTRQLEGQPGDVQAMFLKDPALPSMDGHDVTASTEPTLNDIEDQLLEGDKQIGNRTEVMSSKVDGEEDRKCPLVENDAELVTRSQDTGDKTKTEVGNDFKRSEVQSATQCDTRSVAEKTKPVKGEGDLGATYNGIALQLTAERIAESRIGRANVENGHSSTKKLRRGPRISGNVRRIVHCQRRRRTETPTTQLKIKFCLACGDSQQPDGEPLRQCATCDEAFFCSTKCQRASRNKHRETCKGVKRNYCKHSRW